jgi:hypothetical protein
MAIPQGVGESGSSGYSTNSRELGWQAVNQQAETDAVKVFGRSKRVGRAEADSCTDSTQDRHLRWDYFPKH